MATLNLLWKNGTVVPASTASSIVLRNAHGRFNLATPGLEEACDMVTILLSFATGKATSQALLVSGPATASTLSSVASLRIRLAACAGFAPSS